MKTIAEEYAESFETCMKALRHVGDCMIESIKEMETRVQSNTYNVEIKVDGDEDPRKVAKQIHEGLLSLTKAK